MAWAIGTPAHNTISIDRRNHDAFVERVHELGGAREAEADERPAGDTRRAKRRATEAKRGQRDLEVGHRNRLVALVHRGVDEAELDHRAQVLEEPRIRGAAAQSGRTLAGPQSCRNTLAGYVRKQLRARKSWNGFPGVQWPRKAPVGSDRFPEWS